MSASHDDIGPPPSGSTLPLRRSIVPSSSFPLATDEQGGVDSGEGVLSPASDSLDGREGVKVIVCLIPISSSIEQQKARLRCASAISPPSSVSLQLSASSCVFLRPTLRPASRPFNPRRISRPHSHSALPSPLGQAVVCDFLFPLPLADARSRPGLLQTTRPPSHQGRSRPPVR